MALTLHLGGSPGKGSHYLRPHNGHTMTRTIFYGFPESLGYYSALPGASWPVVFRVEDSWHMEAGPAHGNRIFILSYKKALLLYKDRVQLYVAVWVLWKQHGAYRRCVRKWCRVQQGETDRVEYGTSTST